MAEKVENLKMNKCAKVVAVNISEKKGTVKHPVDEVVLKEDFGIVGDAHAGPGIRQVSLLSIESINKFKKLNNGLKGICEGKFAENITTEGITLYELPVGTKIQIGETIQQVSQIGKKCHADQGCQIFKLVGTCIMPKEGIFTTVLKGGKIKAGDKIKVLN